MFHRTRLSPMWDYEFLHPEGSKKSTIRYRIYNHLTKPQKRYTAFALFLYNIIMGYYAWCLFDDAKGSYLMHNYTRKKLVEAGAVATDKGIAVPVGPRGDTSVPTQAFTETVSVEPTPVSEASVLWETRTLNVATKDFARRNAELATELALVTERHTVAVKRQIQLAALAAHQRADLIKNGVHF